MPLITAMTAVKAGGRKKVKLTGVIDSLDIRVTDS